MKKLDEENPALIVTYTETWITDELNSKVLPKELSWQSREDTSLSGI